MINLSHKSDKFVSVHSKCSKIPLSTLVRVRRTRELLITTFVYAGSSVQNASEKFVLCIRLSLVNIDLHLLIVLVI
jgi:hypothetical protein